MNEETAQQILAELKGLRRANQIASSAALVILIAVCVYGYVRLRQISPPGRRPPYAARTPQPETWEAVRTAIDRLDYNNAAATARGIVHEYPNDYYGYTYLGWIALAQGHPKEAEADYARAYELLPTEKNQKMLEAIRKRIANETKTSAQ
jgi:cytochrome c-type biogenesis protein CcmH/NrfG